jgi:hypothetical protein
MRSKRLTTLMLSAVMALTTMGLAASAVSADYDEHPNIVIQVAIRLDNIDATSNNYKKANQSVKMLKELRHWIREHGTPRFVRRVGCTDEFQDWMLSTRTLARQGFRYFRVKATNGQEYPSGWERQAAKIRAKIMYNRAASRQEDDQDDFLDCVFDNLPRRAQVLFF